MLFYGCKTPNLGFIFSQKNDFILFFECNYLILTQYKKDALKIYFEKLRNKVTLLFWISHSNPTSYFTEPNISKNSKAFRNYAPSYTVEVLNSQCTASQLNITKVHFKISLKDLVTEIRGLNIT